MSSAPKNPDTFVVLGGSSACDVAKVVALMDGNPPADGQYTHDYLAELHAGLALAKKAREGMNGTHNLTYPPPWRAAPTNVLSPVTGARIRTICIPTTLSAAEYTPYAGATDDRTVEKKQFSHRTIAPAAVITDGRLALLTPAAGVWVPSGVRAIDHCVESFVSAETNTVSEGLAVAGLTKLLPALLATATGTEDPAGTDRLQAHLGARDSVHASMQPGVKCPVGASHGIGHIMGPYGVQHGHTSCVLLPNVMRWSQPAIVEKQRELSEAIWECHPSVAAVLEKRGLRRADASLADLLDAIFRELGMPRTLGEVGIGEDKIEEIAAKSMLDPCIPYNARPITRKEDIVEILRTAL